MPASSLNLGIAGLELPNFSIRPVPDESELVFQVSGNGDMAAIEPLTRYLKGVHAEALRLGAAVVRLDVRDLYFLNSSCLKSLLSWVSQLASDATPAYRVSFVTSPQLHWQRRSLEALRRLAPQVVSVG
jgi:hypothetical protein